MSVLGRWTGGAQTQGDLPESWTAPSGLFPTEARNDSSVYTFTSSTSTLTLPSSGLADGYLLVARFEYHDATNGRYAPRGKIVQASGTGTVVGSPSGGSSRNDNNDETFITCWTFVDNPSASATFQFQWMKDAGEDADASSGTNRSSFDVIPFYYSNHGLYTSSSAALYSGTTPNQVTGWSASDESDTGAIEISSDVVTVKGDGKRYLVLSSQFYEGREGRTQRWLGHEYDGTHDRAAQAWFYSRSAATDSQGGNVFDVVETVTADRTIEVVCYEGDGTAAGEGGSSNAGTTPSSGAHSLVVLELPASAEVFRTHDGTGGQTINGGSLESGQITDLNIARTGDVDINDSDSFTRASDTAINVEADMDAFVWANVGAAYDTLEDLRFTAQAEITVNGTEDTALFHGAYSRGSTSTDALGWAANPVGFVGVSSGDDLGVSATHVGQDGNVGTQADWVGFGGVNLDSLTSSSTPGSASPAATARSFTMPASTPAGGAVTTPAATARSFTVPAASTVGGAVTTPAATATTIAVPAASVAGSAVVTPNEIVVSATLPTTIEVGGAVVAPSASALSFTIPAVTASEGASAATVTPGDIAAALTIPAASTSGGAVTTPGEIVTTLTIPAASPVGGAVTTPDEIASVVSIPGVSLVGAAVVAPDVLQLTFDIPQASTTTSNALGRYHEGALTVTIQASQLTVGSQEAGLSITSQEGGLV